MARTWVGHGRKKVFDMSRGEIIERIREEHPEITFEFLNQSQYTISDLYWFMRAICTNRHHWMWGAWRIWFSSHHKERSSEQPSLF